MKIVWEIRRQFPDYVDFMIAVPIKLVQMKIIKQLFEI